MEGVAKLTKQDWLRAGLKALAQRGSSALKADLVARSLNVSRGSFYWHFKDVSEYHAAVLSCWEEEAVDKPFLAASILHSSSPSVTLANLISLALSAPTDLETAIFSWAKSYSPAAKSVERVNEKRIRKLSELFEALGHDQEAAKMRAYIATSIYLGHMHFGDTSYPDSKAKERIVELLSL